MKYVQKGAKIKSERCGKHIVGEGEIYLKGGGMVQIQTTAHTPDRSNRRALISHLRVRKCYFVSAMRRTNSYRWRWQILYSADREWHTRNFPPSWGYEVHHLLAGYCVHTSPSLSGYTADVNSHPFRSKKSFPVWNICQPNNMSRVKYIIISRTYYLQLHVTNYSRSPLLTYEYYLM